MDKPKTADDVLRDHALQTCANMINGLQAVIVQVYLNRVFLSRQENDQFTRQMLQFSNNLSTILTGCIDEENASQGGSTN